MLYVFVLLLIYCPNIENLYLRCFYTKIIHKYAPVINFIVSVMYFYIVCQKYK